MLFVGSPSIPQERDTWFVWLTKDASGFFTFVSTIIIFGQAILFFMQLKFIRAGMHDTTIAANAARDGALAAFEANKITQENFLYERRPWLLWSIPPISVIKNNGRHLEINIVGDLSNIGKAPALVIMYFGKFYTTGNNEPAVNKGMAYFTEHLRESMQGGFSLASALPTEKIPMRFGPHGIDVSSLPQEGGFTLFLAFHAKYEFVFGSKQVAEIGTVYMVQPVGTNTASFRLRDLGSATPVHLLELPGARRLT